MMMIRVIVISGCLIMMVIKMIARQKKPNLLQHIHSRHMAAVKAQKSELLMQFMIVGGFYFKVSFRQCSIVKVHSITSG